MGVIWENFSLGWQNRAGHGLMKDEALMQCQDLDMLELGVLRCIRNNKEVKAFDDAGYTWEVLNVFQLDVEGKNVQLVYYTVEDTLYRWNSNTGVHTSIQTEIDNSNVSYAPFKSLLSTKTYVYITDGNKMLCDDGANSMTWGIDPPENPLHASALGSGGGFTAGDYKWQYTFYDKLTGAESNPCPLMGPVTAVDDDSADVYGMEMSSNSRVTSRRLYRTLSDGGSSYLVREINDNVTTELLDTLADDELTTLMETDQGVPPTFGVVRNFQNRLWGCKSNIYPNKVWFSRGSRPDNWPETYYLEVRSVDDKVLDMLEFEGTLFFLHSAGISGLYGTTPDTFAWYKTRSHVGMAGEYSASVGPDGIYFLGYDGVYRFDGVKSSRVSEPIGRTFGKLANEWVDIVDWDRVNSVCRSCFLNGVFYIILPLVDEDGTSTNRVLWYDTFQQLWGRYNMDLDFIWTDQGRGKLYGSFYNGPGYSVYELLEDNNARLYYNDPVPTVVTKKVQFGREERGTKVKWLRRFRIDAEGDWTFYFYVDDELRYTKVLTGLSAADRYKWYDMEEEVKGLSVYVKAVGTAPNYATNRVLRRIEVE